ncbi:MAG: flavodoxin family protein [Treponema sp.]|jgi:multimeric flavodoxin WrbA|nr:flavodoxin family protein [Treponema sp.]
MKFLVITGNPKQDGLCHGVTEEILRGAKEGGAETEVLKVDKLERCHVCGGGWGTCRELHTCSFGKDGFDSAQEQVKKADAFCFITPVYWGEMAEGLKSFFDRLRRCEATKQFNGKAADSIFAGKQVLLVASPGGTGNGALTCLEQMDRFCRHTGAVIFDYVTINRWNNDYKKQAAYSAAKAIAEGRKNGVSL